MTWNKWSKLTLVSSDSNHYIKLKFTTGQPELSDAKSKFLEFSVLWFHLYKWSLYKPDEKELWIVELKYWNSVIQLGTV